MEKKGDVLNQIGIISDLLENINLNAYDKSIIFDLKREEFDRIHKLIKEKSNENMNIVKNRFSVKVGEVNVVFNTSNA